MLQFDKSEVMTGNQAETPAYHGIQEFEEHPKNTGTEVRESVSEAIPKWLPKWARILFEAFITWLCGCPHRGQRPLVHRPKTVYTLEAVAGFVIVVALGYLLIDLGAWFLLPIQWILLTGRAWALFNIFHHATHKTLFRNERMNRAIAFACSILAFSSSLDSYRREHIRSHHTKAMCTYEDEEAAFMPLGFPPGMPKAYYYRRLLRLVMMPTSYLVYTKYRLWDWLKGEPLWRKATVWGFGAGLIVVSAVIGELSSLGLAYIFPMFVVFNITGLLGTFSEHHWGTLLDAPPRLRLVLLQQSRFLLDPAPPAGAWGAWSRWWLRLVFYHLPVRVGVLPGDSLHHDHHHRHPRTEHWTMSTFERFQHLENGCPGFRDHPHTHAWSLGEAIDRVFSRMSAAPPPDAETLSRWKAAEKAALTGRREIK
ncbi:fatty acid desaturase family protein [Amycolatopsis japonica]|uniref:fatty acid desaturase family protein n=1 Tax=Amycolatopsis japonica TaxID=208439 RepID=UPI00366CC06F